VSVKINQNWKNGLATEGENDRESVVPNDNVRNAGIILLYDSSKLVSVLQDILEVVNILAWTLRHAVSCTGPGKRNLVQH
jgi:hypothetical protein